MITEQIRGKCRLLGWKRSEELKWDLVGIGWLESGRELGCTIVQNFGIAIWKAVQ
jgi:hypothetical protein